MVGARHAAVFLLLPVLSGCGGGGAPSTCGTAAADGGPVVVATGMQGAQAIAVDATNVYWVKATDFGGEGPVAPDGEVLQCAKCACDHPTILAANEPISFSGIAVDTTSVYFTNGDVMRVPIGGGEAVALVVAQTTGAIAVDATSVYWTDTRGLMKVPIEGGSPTILVPRDDVVAIALDAKNVYYVAGSGIFEVRLAGGPPKELAQTTSPQSIAVDSASVYWTDNGTQALGGAALFKVPIAGGNPAMLAAGFSNRAGLAVDATGVYWTGDSGVMKISASGGKPTTLASGDVVSSASGIALDATSVYWTNGIEGPAVMRLPK